MAELKTKLSNAPAADFFATIADAQVREDCLAIAEIMKAATKSDAKMWGAGIVGFGEHRIVYAGGREGDWMMIGFSPRKQNIALYLGLGGMEGLDMLLADLGKHSTGKGCLYIKRLSDIHLPTLKKLVRASVEQKTNANAQARRTKSKQ